MTDPVNHPAHYEQGPFECIELTQYFDFCIGNAIKYVWRHNTKGKPYEDLSKALWYVQWEMDSTHSSDYHTPIPVYRKLCDLADCDFANMADFWNAIYKGELEDAKHAIQKRAETLMADYKPRAILTPATMPPIPEPPTIRHVAAWRQGEQLQSLRKHSMTLGKVTQLMRARGFAWSDHALNYIEQGIRTVKLDEALALLEIYGYTGANMFTAIDFILGRTQP